MVRLPCRFTAAVLFCAFVSASSLRAAPPAPVGTHHIEVSYQTTGGPVSFSGDRNYNGTNPIDATNLGGAPNIGAFTSRQAFAWRDRVKPFHPFVIRGNEVVISHAFFKVNPSGQADNGSEFFPDLVQDGSITFDITGLHFDQPVYVDESTFLVHVLWDIDQADQLPNPYHHHHCCHSATEPFRDVAVFFSPVAVFADHPDPNYTWATVVPTITGQGTDTLTVSLTLPYAMLQHLSDMDQGAPPGLPAPQGFLEPFHVHFEYSVAAAAEPAVAAAVSRKPNVGGPAGQCDLSLIPARKSEPRDSGIGELRLRFNAPPGVPAGSGVVIEQATCAAPAFIAYDGSSTIGSTITGNDMLLTFTPALENGRTYRILFDPQVTPLANERIEIRALVGDANNDGFANATDRSTIVAAWTGPDRFSCNSDLNSSGFTNATDRSIVVGAWTGAQRCAP